MGVPTSDTRDHPQGTQSATSGTASPTSRLARDVLGFAAAAKLRGQPGRPCRLGAAATGATDRVVQDARQELEKRGLVA